MIASRLVLVLGVVAACKGKPGWQLDAPDLHVHAEAFRVPYESIADVASVRPGLEVVGVSTLRDALQAKLVADRVGRDGSVRVDLRTQGPSDAAGVIVIDVRVTAGWSTAAGRTSLRATLTGKVRFQSKGDVRPALTRAIGQELAGEIEKLFPGVEPAHVVPLVAPAPAIAIATGLHMSCSLHRDGTVRCWGGDAPRLGPVPVAIAGIASATQIAVGEHLGCARLADGTAACWNPDAWPATADELVATKVCGVDHLHAVTAGCGLGDDGHVACWSAADLGDCARPDVRTIPRVAPNTSWQTCALDASHAIQCTAAPPDAPAPADLDPAIGRVIASSATPLGACVLAATGEVWCDSEEVPFTRVVYAAP